MIAILPAAGAVLLESLAQVLARGDRGGRTARRLASLGVAAALAVVLVGLVGANAWGTDPPVSPRRSADSAFALHSEGLLGLVPVVTLLVGLLAVCLAPLASHGPRTFARILRLLAIALAVVAVTHPLALAALFALSGWTLWRALEERGERGAARVVARYHAPSVALVASGSILLASGREGEGALCWLLGIAIREAVLPMHGWLPVLAERAPLGLFVAFVAPQLGVTAHLQLLTDVVPQGLAHEFAMVGAVTAVVAAGLGLVQSEARRAVAYLIVSQTGLVAFGLENESIVGRTGALLSWQVLALATSGFAMTLAALEARRGRLSLRVPGGSFDRTPRMAVAFLFLGFASVGLPATLGFVAEDLLLQGSVHEFPRLGFALIAATALNGMNVLRCFFALFSGSREHRGETDLTGLEAGALTIVLGVLLFGGLFPGVFLGLAT